MRTAIFIFCIVPLLLFNVSSNAQPSQYRFSRIDITQGLSNNEVNCIYKDEKGFLWFGTRSGLNRFDGYKFKVFKHDLRDTTSIVDEEIHQIFEGPDHKLFINAKSRLVIYDLLTEKFDSRAGAFLQSMGIPDTALSDVKKDSEGNYWVLCVSAGLYRYNPVTRKSVSFFQGSKNAAYSDSGRITDFGIGPQGTIWAVSNTGELQKIEPKTGKITWMAELLGGEAPNNPSDYVMYVDAQGDLWIHSTLGGLGVFYYTVSSGQFIHIIKGKGKGYLNNDVVHGIAQDQNGLIWVATDHGGINLIDKRDFTVKYLINQEDDDHSINQNSIDALYIDNKGIVWIGTFKKGICYYHKGIIKFTQYQHKPSEPNSLPFNDVNRFVEDAKGNLWIASNGGGLIYFDRKSGKYTKYTHDAQNENSLSNDVIVSLCLDHNQTLWIGTYFGGLDNFDGKKFTHYKHSAADPNSISDNAIWAILEDSKQRLWLGTFASGLDRFDRESNKFVHYKPTGYHSVHCAYVCDFLEAKNGDIWIATSSGLDVYENKTNDFSLHFTHDNAKPLTSLSNDNTIAIHQDSRGLIWVATREGLDYFDPAKNEFTTLTKEDGLPDNIITSVVEDHQHNLWVGTPSGLSNIIVYTDQRTGKLSFQFKNYYESDGLQGREFNEYAAYATKEGELIFGGANGFNLFTPQQLDNIDDDPRLVLTDLQMFNKSVNVGEKLNGHTILPQAISETNQITLEYNENVFSIEFAALNFFNTAKLHYAYTLEGFNNEWFVADDKTHKATYTNLDPGTYTFKVRTVSEKGIWSKEGALLVIEILPPFWRTPLAYVFYFLLFAASLYIARRMVLKRASARFAIQQERMEAQRLHDLDMMKIRFFTNVSHDFRTPLSLIITPLDKMIKNAAEPAQKHQFQMIHRNARRLLNLVNQLMDFRKMEMQELKLNPLTGDIVSFIRNISYSFTDIAEKKNIAFSYQSSVGRFITQFDHDKIERIFFNLLSNAFKFTPGNGCVSVEINSKNTESGTSLEIKVSDTGIGIPLEKQEKVFERFFQNDLPGNIVNQGSGIGLAITKEFVKLHNGSIVVESEVNKGSCFTILLPLKNIGEAQVGGVRDLDEKEIDISPLFDEAGNPDEGMGIPLESKASEKASKKPMILIVEDNEDLRFYLKDNLKQYFNIIEAPNGKAGWQKALAAHPDLIVSDINMPEMTGIELCRKLKGDKRTYFVPVILLTALTGDEQQLKGLETGASDYITKPFNFEILLSKIRNLLAQQETVKRTYLKHVNTEPTEIHVESPDEKFMQQVLEVVEKNIANPDFSVEELSRELCMSRVALYKKMLSLSFKTPIEYIRTIRMKRAAQLLEKSKLTIAEIAYEVGFNDPKYFSRFFKAEFNMLPSAYQAEKRKETNPANAAMGEEKKQ